MNRNGAMLIMDERCREVARYNRYGAHIWLKTPAGCRRPVACDLDPFTFAILTEVGGHVKFQDLKEGMTYEEETDQVTGLSHMVVKDSPDEKKQPRMEMRNASNKILKTYQMPVRANLMVNDGEDVEPGDVIAKIPRETTKTKDITGGLPRVSSCSKLAVRRSRGHVGNRGMVKRGPISRAAQTDHYRRR